MAYDCEEKKVVLFQQKIAEVLDVYTHDFTSIDVLSEKGPITAGELSKGIGLTTDSVTALIDKLESTGFVRREKHLKDRRSIIIVPQYEEKKKSKQLIFNLIGKCWR
ncbi:MULTISPECIES: MarR family transcriptional regulator [Staphylococcus]|uniref:MarR family transcriptional regulator n=1 Tax=Staphylococcus TaxID=1279 RepID=UPI001F324AE2|nr:MULTISPECIES: MarR family transcriptional regulator [Staphylococcus]MDW8568836.1 MarR family transcriptional regulator [Staphylococcus shinii]